MSGYRHHTPSGNRDLYDTPLSSLRLSYGESASARNASLDEDDYLLAQATKTTTSYLQSELRNRDHKITQLEQQLDYMASRSREHTPLARRQQQSSQRGVSYAPREPEPMMQSQPSAPWLNQQEHHMKSMVEQFELQLDTLERTNKRLQEELFITQDERDKYYSVLNDMRSSLRDQEQNAVNVSENTQYLVSKCHKLRERNQVMAVELAEKNALLQRQQEQVEQLNRTLERTEEEFAHTRSRYKKLQEEVNHSKESKSNSDAEREQLKREHAKQLKTIEELKTQLQKCEPKLEQYRNKYSEKDQLLKSQSDLFTEQTKQLTDEVKQLKTTLETERNNLRKETEQKRVFKKQVQQITRDYDRVSTQYDELLKQQQHEAKSTMKNEEKVQTLTRQMSDMSIKNEELKEKLYNTARSKEIASFESKLQESAEKLKKRDAKVEEQRRQLSKLQAQLAEKSERIHELEVKVASLETHQSWLQAPEGNLSRTSSTVEAESGSGSGSGSGNPDVITSVIQTRQENAVLKRENESLKEEIAKVKAENDELTEQLQEFEQMQSKYKFAMDQAETLNRQIRGLNQVIQENEEDFEQQKKDMQSAFREALEKAKEEAALRHEASRKSSVVSLFSQPSLSRTSSFADQKRKLDSALSSVSSKS